MARIISQTLIRSQLNLNPSSILSIPLSQSSSAAAAASSSLLMSFRCRSSRSEKPQVQAHLIEIDLDSDSDIDSIGIRRLEDAIHGIIARSSAPDWLPFIPGSSYWVPPRRRPLGVVELIGRLARPMSEEQSLSLTTLRGWPSSLYFIEGADASPHPVKPKVKRTGSQSEDEES